MSPLKPEGEPSTPRPMGGRDWGCPLPWSSPGQLCQSLAFTKDERSKRMLPYSGKEVPVLPDPQSRGLRHGTVPTEGDNLVSSMQLSVFQVGVTPMLYPVSKLETVCSPGSVPCCGRGLWAGLERAEGNGLRVPGLASVPPLEQTGEWQHSEGIWSSWLPSSQTGTFRRQGVVSGWVSLCQARESPRAAITCVQNRQLCSSLASRAHPREVPVSFPSCSSSGGGEAVGGWETVSPSSLELAIFTSAWALVLSSGPSPPKCAYC